MKKSLILICMLSVFVGCGSSDKKSAEAAVVEGNPASASECPDHRELSQSARAVRAGELGRKWAKETENKSPKELLARYRECKKRLRGDIALTEASAPKTPEQ